MASQDFPSSFRDPLYAALDASTEQRLGLPVGMLSAVRTEGERSNANQVSSDGARTPYQILPSTRKAILEQYGLDAYLSPQTASEAAGLLLRDSLKRAGGNEETAVREYHGGTDPKNWGKLNDAYWRRVSAGMHDASVRAMAQDFGRWMASNPATPEPSAATVQAQTPQQDKMVADFRAWADGAGQIPGTALPDRQPAAIDVPLEQPVKAPGVIDKAIGAGEAGLAALTGATGGAVGMAGGLVKGIADQVASGQFGNPADRTVENAMAAGARAGTYEPRTETGQRYAQTVAEAAQALVPVAPLTGELSGLAAGTAAARQTVAPLIATAADRVMTKAATGKPVTPAGAVSEAAPGAAPSSAQPAAAVVQPPAATLGEAIETAKRAAGGSQSATSDLAAIAAPNEATVAAAKRLGIEGYLQPDHVTTSQVYRELAQAVKSVPGSAARASELEGLRAVGERAAKIIDDLGGADTSAVGENVKVAGLARVAQLTDQAEKLFGSVREAIAPTTPTAVPDTMSLIRSRATELGGPENLSSMERSIAKKLAPRKDGTKPTYALVDDVRKDVGAVVGRGGPFADADIGLAKRYYGALSDDQLRIAEASGQKWWYLAGQYAVKLRKGIEDDLSSLFGKELDKSIAPKLSSATTALPGGDASRLAKILDATPDALRQQVAAAGLKAAFATQATNGPITFSRYQKWYEGLLQNRESYRVVMSNLPPQARKHLSDLYRVSRGIADASRERITTGRIQAVQEQFNAPDSLAGRLYDAARRGAVGAAVGTAAGHLLGGGVGGAVASALTKGPKPKAITAVDGLIASAEFELLAMAQTQPQQAAAVRALARTTNMRSFMAAIGRAASSQQEREAWIYDAMRPTPAIGQSQDRDRKTIH